MTLRNLEQYIVDFHVNWLFWKTALSYYHLKAKGNIQFLSTDLLESNFNNSSLLISQLYRSSHFNWFVNNSVTSYDIMAVLSLLKTSLNFLAFEYNSGILDL